MNMEEAMDTIESIVNPMIKRCEREHKQEIHILQQAMIKMEEEHTEDMDRVRAKEKKHLKLIMYLQEDVIRLNRQKG